MQARIWVNATTWQPSSEGTASLLAPAGWSGHHAKTYLLRLMQELTDPCKSQFEVQAKLELSASIAMREGSCKLQGMPWER